MDTTTTRPAPLRKPPTPPAPLTLKLARASWMAPLIGMGVMSFGSVTQDTLQKFIVTILFLLFSLVGLACAAVSLAGIRRYGWRIVRNAAGGVVLSSIAFVPFVIAFAGGYARGVTAAAGEECVRNGVALVEGMRNAEGEAALRECLADPRLDPSSRILAVSELGMALHRQGKSWEGYELTVSEASPTRSP